MKRFLQGALMFIVIAGFGTFGLFILAVQHLAPTKTEGGAEKIVASADFAALSLANAGIDRLKIDPNHQCCDKNVIESPLRLDREQVEVVARSVTFPHVIKIGEYMLSGEYPNAGILCLDAAYYAGKVQGLIWAMDRDTIMEHRLYWIIDNASELFQSCVSIFSLEALPDENANDKNQLEDVKAILSGQIRLIQQKLSYARDVKIKAHQAPALVPFTRVPDNRLATGVFGADRP